MPNFRGSIPPFSKGRSHTILCFISNVVTLTACTSFSIHVSVYNLSLWHKGKHLVQPNIRRIVNHEAIVDIVCASILIRG